MQVVSPIITVYRVFRKTDRTVVYTCSFCGKETEIVVAVVTMWSRFGSRDLHRASLEDITEERPHFSME